MAIRRKKQRPNLRKVERLHRARHGTSRAPMACMQLGGEDTAWLHMEDETNAMVVTALFELDGTLDMARVWAILRARGMPPRFRAKVVETKRPFALPRFELDSTFDVERHLMHVELEPGEQALRNFVSEEVGKPLEHDRPLWRTYVIDRAGEPTAILFRVHHALADGFALLAQLLAICDEHESRPAPLIPSRGTRRTGLLGQGLAAARLFALPPDSRTALKNELGRRKNVAWARPFPLDLVKASARRASATVNDVLVSAAAGAVGGYLREQGEDVGEVRAMVPVNLRRTAGAELGNDFGLVILALPVGIRDPRARLTVVKHRMDRLKATPEAGVAKALLNLLGHLPRRLEWLGARFFSTKSSLVLTNVPGPLQKLHLGGVPIERIVFWVPEAVRLGLGLSIFSYAGSVSVGVVADAQVTPEPGAIVDKLEAELGALELARPHETAAPLT